MSLRQIAKELGVNHTLLVLWKQGKRRLAPELEARYMELVTTFGGNGYNSRGALETASPPAPPVAAGAGDGIRTHDNLLGRLNVASSWFWSVPTEVGWPQ